MSKSKKNHTPKTLKPLEDKIAAAIGAFESEGEMLTANLETAAAPVASSDFSDPVEAALAELAIEEAAKKPKLVVAEGELGEMIASVDAEISRAIVEQVSAELKTRTAYENTKSPDNVNIHKTLAKCEKSLARTHAARLFAAAQVSPAFINRNLQKGAKYNVYAILKLSDFVDGLVGSGMSNAINIACMRSLFACKKAGIAFTGELAKAAASDKIHVAEAARKHLIRHTVSKSTAPTQASSTMQALQTLGAVKINGSRKNPVYELIDGPVARRLEALVGGYSAGAAEEMEDVA